VINENDTVATEEIRYGDNDRLAARVAQMTSADALVLFSDIDGLYTADPRKDNGARHLPEIGEMTAEIEAMAGKAPLGYSSGGMVTKLAAARIAMAAGCRMAIADGRAAHPLEALIQGARCTWFLAPTSPPAARKGWIAGSLRAAGTLVVDDGAAAALRKGKSLLPAGVVKVAGDFERGDAVAVEDRRGKRLGRGLVAYSSADCTRIIGHKSGEIAAILGYRGRDEMVHRDDLVLDT
jgi:glutamate 5-kinase